MQLGVGPDQELSLGAAGVDLLQLGDRLGARSRAGVWPPGCVLPPSTQYFVMKGGRVPLIPYHRPGAPEAAELVAATIEKAPTLRGVLLDRLGPTVWHDSPAAAMAELEEL